MGEIGMRQHIRTAALLFACAAPAIADERRDEAGNEMPGTVVSRPLTSRPTLTPVRYTEPGTLPAPTPAAPMTMPEMVGPGSLAARQMLGTAPAMSGLGCPTGCVPAGCTPGSAGCGIPAEGARARLSRWLFYTHSGTYGYAPCERYPYTVPLYAYFPCRSNPRWVKGMYAGTTLAGCSTGGCINAGSSAPFGATPPQPGLHPYPTQSSPMVVPAPMSPNFTDAKGVPVQRPTQLPAPTSAPKAGSPAMLPAAIPSAANTRGSTATPVGYRPVGGSGPVYQQTPMLSPAYYRLPPMSAATPTAATEATPRTTMTSDSYKPVNSTGGSSKPSPNDR